ncbi:hypothetical protein KRR40_33650 [Niabella defluvii]|nr:hypothetical protein KRR40_33650 [Niabella sp. I65]
MGKSCLKYRVASGGYLKDYWQMGMGRSSSNTENTGTCSGNNWIEFTTPLLVKGKYKVWFCYYTQNSTVSAVQASFNGTPLTSALIEFHKIYPPYNLKTKPTWQPLAGNGGLARLLQVLRWAVC